MNLKVSNLTKQYGGFSALFNVSFNANPGEIIGLLGRNGTGKTTTIKCIIGAIQPTSGSISFNDNRSKIPIGYLPEERGLYLSATVYEQGVYFAELNNLERPKEALIKYRIYTDFTNLKCYNRDNNEK